MRFFSEKFVPERKNHHRRHLGAEGGNNGQLGQLVGGRFFEARLKEANQGIRFNCWLVLKNFSRGFLVNMDGDEIYFV